MTVILKLLSENKEGAVEKIVENKNLLLKIRNRILRFGYRKLLTNIQWQILNLTCKVIKDRIRSLLLKNKIKIIIEKILPNIITKREQRIIYHITQLRNSIMKILKNLEGAIKDIYSKLMEDWEYLYYKAINILTGETMGAHIKY